MEDYSLLKSIGKGSYGEVFLVSHRSDSKQYVLKTIELASASDKERTAAEQEASLLSRLKHPNIVSYRESFQDGHGLLHIVMAFCEGGDLHRRLKQRRGQLLSERQILKWCVQIALALQHLHEQNIMHRDLKTQNIFLTKSDMIKVGDLGIARVLESSSDMATTLIGTPYYMSPELFANRPYNQKSDVWALGCVVYEMATLKHAFDARDMNGLVYKIVRGKIPPMPKNYSPDLCDMIRSMLSQSPARRPSITRLLKTEFIKSHIRLFLDESKRRKSSVKSRRQGSDSDHASPSEGEPPQLSRDVRKDLKGSGAVGMEVGSVVRRGSSVSSSTDSNSSSSEQTTTTISKRPLPPTPPHVVELKEKPSITGSEKPSAEENSNFQTFVPNIRPTSLERPEVLDYRKDSGSGQSGAQYNKVARAKRREKSQFQQSPITCPKPGRKCPVQSDAIMKVESAAINIEDELEQTFVVHEGVDASTGPDVNADEQMLCTIMGTCTIAQSEDSHSTSRHSVFLSDDEDDNPDPQELTVSGSPTGRLFDRVQKLKSDCLRGLGKDTLQQCLSVLAEEADSDSAEDSLVKLLGQEQFDLYGVKLSELHFCEESLYGMT